MRSLHVGTAFALHHPPAATDHEVAAAPSRQEKREWTISEMARDFSLTLRALRFYESRGLLAPQRFGSARYYSPRDRIRLSLILNAKRMGFTLSETARMLGTTSGGDQADLQLSPDTVDSQIAYLETQREAIETALGSLRQRRTALPA